MSIAPYLDPALEQRFKDYDSLLYFKWNGEMNLWELWRGNDHILRVCEDDNSYRTPDERLLAHLHRIDSWSRRGGGLDIAHEIDARNEQARAARMRAIRLA